MKGKTMKPPSLPEGTAGPASKKVDLVTGSNGRLGREMIHMLLKRGDTVRVLVKRKDFVVHLPTGVVPYVGDLGDTHILADACNGVDTVFHFAAIVSEHKETVDTIMRVNVDGTRNVLDACEQNHVNRMIFASTVDVYGRKRRDLLTEESQARPTDKYGYSKMLAEQVIARYHVTVPSTILRFATIYGKGFEAAFFRMFQMIKEDRFAIIGNGKNKLNLLHVYDAMQALMLADMKDIAKNKIYNITDGNTYTQEQLIELASKLLHAPTPTRHVYETLAMVLAKARKADADDLRFITSSRQIDISKAQQELGYEPRVSIEQGGEDLVAEFNKLGRR